MYEIIKNVINSGRFELTDIMKKIDTIWLQGDITDEEKTELIALAREKADPENSYAPLQKQIDELFASVKIINETVKSIGDRVTKLEGGSVIPPQPEEYPEYKQPTGAHDAYHNGDKVTFNGERYTCIAPEGTAVVWSPSDYPAYWQKVQ